MPEIMTYNDIGAALGACVAIAGVVIIMFDILSRLNGVLVMVGGATMLTISLLISLSDNQVLTGRQMAVLAQVIQRDPRLRTALGTRHPGQIVTTRDYERVYDMRQALTQHESQAVINGDRSHDLAVATKTPS